MKKLILLSLCCITLASCAHVPPQVEEVYTCVTPVMDEVYYTLKGDVEKALLNESVDWLKDLEVLARKHGVQTISCILEVFLHPPTVAPTMMAAMPTPAPKVDVKARAQEFLSAHKVTFNPKK